MLRLRKKELLVFKETLIKTKREKEEIKNIFYQNLN